MEAGKSPKSTPLGSKDIECNFIRKTQRIYSLFYSDSKKTLALKEVLPKYAILQWKLQYNALPFHGTAYLKDITENAGCLLVPALLFFYHSEKNTSDNTHNSQQDYEQALRGYR